MNRKPWYLLAGAVLVAAGCGSSHHSSTPTTRASKVTPLPAAGSARLALGAQTQNLTVQNCIDAGGGRLSMTATQGKTTTLTVNLASTVSASTMVLTLRGPGNGFTNYAMSSTSGTTPTGGGHTGNTVRLAGPVTMQAFDASGKPTGSPEKLNAELTAQCVKVLPTQPAPHFGTTPTTTTAKRR